MLKRGRGVREGEARSPLPDSASTIWMRHYVINDCPICWVGDTAEQSHFCAKGQRLREAALAEFRAIPPPPKKRPAADTPFNPAIASKRDVAKLWGANNLIPGNRKGKKRP